MQEHKELNAQDRKLLHEIEEIVAGEATEAQELDSLQGFCAHLNSTFPEADTNFQTSLETKLLHKLKTWQESAKSDESVQDLNDAQLRPWKQCVTYLRQLTFQKNVFPFKTGFRKYASLATAATLIVLFGGVWLNVPQHDQFPNSTARKDEQVPENSIFRTQIGDFNDDLFSTTRFEEAQNFTHFHLKAPTVLPKGYALEEIKLRPNRALMIYTGPGHEILIWQKAAKAEILSCSDATIERKKIVFQGQTAVWFEGYGLRWEYQGISYAVGGQELSLEQTVEIAASLQ